MADHADVGGPRRARLAERVGAETGAILDRDGTVVGDHDGAHAFTVGQRRGLRLGVPADDGKPRFVLEVRPKTNEVVVGPKEALAIAEIAGRRFSWAGEPVRDGGEPFRCDVQIRAHADPVPAEGRLVPVALDDGTEAVEFVVVPDVALDGVARWVVVALGVVGVLYVALRVPTREVVLAERAEAAGHATPADDA